MKSRVKRVATTLFWVVGFPFWFPIACGMGLLALTIEGIVEIWRDTK